MKAAVIHQNGGPDALHCEAPPDPVCAAAGGVIDVETVSIEGGGLPARLMTPPASAHAQQRAASAAMVWARPDGLSTRHAAGVPVAFGTAHECRFNAGDLQRGQTALIRAGVLFATLLQAEYPPAHALVADCLARGASGELRLESAKVIALSDAAQAHTRVEGRHAFGRVVMTT